MKNKILLIVFVLVTTIIKAQQNHLSELAEISVLTIGPGTLLNDAFGHNAFRVKDPARGIDLVFNYGVYDFEAPYFYLKFAQGKLNYLIDNDYFEDFFNRYISQNRSIKEHVLNLSQTEKQTLFNYLLNNLKPQNRRYLYDFFYNNCATKIKDVTNIAVNNTIIFNKPTDFKDATFRTLINNNLNANSWGSFGINVALGSVIDKTAPPTDHMFLPENIYKFFEAATIKNTNKPLVKSSRVLYNKIDRPIRTPFFTSPLFVFGLVGIFILYITFSDYKKQKQSTWLDVILFCITGIVGVLLLLLWFATDHKGTHQNYNLLWAFAFNVLVIGQFLKSKISKWFINYLKLLVIMLCLLTLHWLIGVQVFTIGLIPLLIAVFVRYVFLIKHYTK